MLPVRLIKHARKHLADINAPVRIPQLMAQDVQKVNVLVFLHVHCTLKLSSTSLISNRLG